MTDSTRIQTPVAQALPDTTGVAGAGQARLDSRTLEAHTRRSDNISAIDDAPEAHGAPSGASSVALMPVPRRSIPASAGAHKTIRPAPATPTATQISALPFEFDDWDSGRLRVNRYFAGILQGNGLTTFESLDRLATGQVVRQVGERTTARIELADENGHQAFYLKRHGRLSLREILKSVLRATWPVHGARPEWDAILRFHQLGIPTMTPVAFGEFGGRSLLLTVAFEPSINLLDLISRLRRTDCQSALDEISLLHEVVAIAREMHAAGLHHQDFYLNHLLLSPPTENGHVQVIDLGRVRERERLGRRWIVKDLAQLNYSARSLPVKTRLRFLRHYLDRKLTRMDRSLIARIARKSAHIDRHTVKNGL